MSRAPWLALTLDRRVRRVKASISADTKDQTILSQPASLSADLVGRGAEGGMPGVVVTGNVGFMEPTIPRLEDLGLSATLGVARGKETQGQQGFSPRVMKPARL